MNLKFKSSALRIKNYNFKPDEIRNILLIIEVINKHHYEK
jgi:hypothetical protein